MKTRRKFSVRTTLFSAPSSIFVQSVISDGIMNNAEPVNHNFGINPDDTIIAENSLHHNFRTEGITPDDTGIPPDDTTTIEDSLPHEDLLIGHFAAQMDERDPFAKGYDKRPSPDLPLTSRGYERQSSPSPSVHESYGRQPSPSIKIFWLSKK